jgi:hypothetical protein
MPRSSLLLLACLLPASLTCTRPRPAELERVWEGDDASWILAASHFYGVKRRCTSERVVNVRLHVVPRREEYRRGGEAPGDAILAFTACSALDAHRAYRLPHPDHWRLEPVEEAGAKLADTRSFSVTHGAPLDAPGRKTALLLLHDDSPPELDGRRLEPLEDGLLASLLAGAGYAQEEPCGLESELEVRSWLLRGERPCAAPAECDPDSLYLGLLDCRQPFRHAVYRMPGYHRWERPIADRFDESSGDREDRAPARAARSPAREVVLHWWGGVATRHPTEDRWWDWTGFQTLLTPDGARLRRAR